MELYDSPPIALFYIAASLIAEATEAAAASDKFAQEDV
jgi:hypothetical protein